MKTRVLQTGSSEPLDAALDEALHILSHGGIVAFPTETVYGLGADASNAGAVEKVFVAKGRPRDNPLIIHVASREQAQGLVSEFPESALRLAEAYWPGPLTLVLRSAGIVPAIATAGLSTVAVRVPDHPIPRGLAARLPSGLVGPSANISGRPSPTTARHVLDDLDGVVDLVLDAGPATIGIESTVVDVSEDIPTILRLGGLSADWIEAVTGRLAASGSEEARKRSPGTRHRHYAPRAAVVVIELGDAAGLQRGVDEARRRGEKVGVITHSIDVASGSAERRLRIGPSTEQIARGLFGAFRSMDDEAVDVLFVEKPPGEGLGAAVIDRILRAASV